MSDNSDVEFCLVSKELLEDRLVSAKAKAMYALLCSCPEGSDRSIKSLAAKLDMRRETASRLISELEDYGYVERTRIRAPDGKHFVTDFRVYPRSTI